MILFGFLPFTIFGFTKSLTLPPAEFISEFASTYNSHHLVIHQPYHYGNDIVQWHKSNAKKYVLLLCFMKI